MPHGEEEPGRAVAAGQRGDERIAPHGIVPVGKRAWIGANVTILPGVSIGDYAVIGAGSVVNKSIPARAIAVGVPARVIGSLDTIAKPEPPEAR